MTLEIFTCSPPGLTITPSKAIDHFGDMAAVLNSVVSNSYYGMFRGQITMYWPSKHPIIEPIEFKMVAASPKKSI